MYSSRLTRHLLARPNPAFQAQTPLAVSRTFTTQSALYARKGAEDKDSLSPRRSEYSQTGGDDAAAENSDAAFNPNKTSPEEEIGTAGQGNNGNPLDVSPGNDAVNRPKPEEGQASKAPERGASGGGSAPKSGGAKSG
ncbi:hypothetical protein M011DRAFT_471166 [Sporormia fimetaria CBS 119925]|uniref:Uncharacterized protein n=1 Tax=Sporormia fimetaria CBS 119925 TaxID=1340428 RepID=A0A6A6V369_9PLEO|nr:hypothetical protein M011DRAFT_471166 [Sporormia fimetaria CBS 119925]